MEERKVFSIQGKFVYSERMSTEVLSVRIRKDLKRQAEKLNIDVKTVVEMALAEAIEKAKRERLRESIKALLYQMKEISEDQWVEAVKECRRER